MFEKKNVERFLSIQHNQYILDLSLIDPSHEPEVIVLQVLQHLIDNHAANTLNNLIIKGKEITEETAKKIYDFVGRNHQLTLNIDLPKNLEHSKIQIQLDQLISNHRLAKNRQKTENKSMMPAQPISKQKEGRLLPQGKIIPRIEITLQENGNLNDQLSIHEEKIPTIKFTNNLPTLDRLPIAADIVTEILSCAQHPLEWPTINRHAEQAFRKNLGSESQFGKDNHPLLLLIKNDDKLKKAFDAWDNLFKFGTEQYNAFLDVYGQYGPSGLIKLFEIWEHYYKDPNKKQPFLDTYIFLLQYMPSYLPFIENKTFQDTLSEITQLSNGTRSWFIALIKNHGHTNRYGCLSSLLQQFNTATLLIQNMGLSFDTIKAIHHTKDLPSTLNEFIELLNKCPRQDQAEQWACIHEITIPDPNPFHFIIPEMKVGTDLNEKGDLKWIQTLLVTNKECNPELVKPAFYLYIATQKQHLPIATYREIINRLFSNNELNNEARLYILYILAKSTSTQAETGFDHITVLNEWVNFETRVIGLKTLTRIKANFGEGLINLGLPGGAPAARIKVLKPIMEMPAIPPMSYLNKLLQLAEGKFLHEGVKLFNLPHLQDEMMKKMSQAALLYKDYPESMMHAIRLIKAEELVAIKQGNKNAGKYYAQPQSITLLEQFISACEQLINYPGANLEYFPKLSPQKVLLPLLTTFHLEYEQNETLNQFINSYEKKLADHLIYKEKINVLLPYGFSLLQLIQNREQPNKLNYEALNKIHDHLMSLICRPEPTTKKEIREWLDKEYGNYFKENELRNVVDDVDLNSLFDKLGCTQTETRSFITKIVSNFNHGEEKDQHEDLVKSLINLTKTLTSPQKVQFFEYCKDAFKFNGLLSREQHSTPHAPSYFSQFKALIESITQTRSFDEFEQFMIIAQEYQSDQGDVSNILAKCTYLLNNLYPLLMKQGVTRREAFNFSAKLICISSLNTLNSYHEQATVKMPIEYPKEFNTLEQFSAEFMQSFNEVGSSTTLLLNQLQKIEEHINAILAFIPKHHKEQLDDNQYNIAEQIKRVAELIDPKNKPNMFMRLLNKQKIPSQKELNKYLEEGYIRAMNKKKIAHRLFNEIKTKELQKFSNVVLHLWIKKTQITEKYSNIRTRSNNFISRALHTSPENMSTKHNDFCQLIDQLMALDDQNLVLSLMYHYTEGLPDRKIEHLIKLFNNSKYKEVPLSLKKDFIHAVIAQMNNSIACSDDDIHSFLEFIHNHKNTPSITQCVHEYYQHAPFPSLPTFIQWANNAMRALPGNEEEIVKNIQAKHQFFDKYPCAFINYDNLTIKHNGREQINGFQLEFAEKLIIKMPKAPQIFTRQYLVSIAEEQNEARILPTQNILDQLKKFKNNPPANHIKIVMLAAELLHRCKGRTPVFLSNSQVAGRSFELNTTQIIAVLSLLETGNKVTAEIGTGEGKSRIMMLLNACQFLKGKTVDFLTSDIALAERDYLQSLPFFNSLGAKVNFITASSEIESYEREGINVSDPENFCLFLNKAFSQNKSDLIPEERALLLDESDVAYFDNNVLYNHSTITPEINIKILPLFSLLMDFFAQEDIEKKYLEDKQDCNEKLLAFIKTRNITLFELLQSIPILQLEQWQDAAYIARRLEYNVDYTVVLNTTILSTLGTKKAAAAKCYVGPRISANANFSNGVHQCLHAELNRLMKTQKVNIKPQLNKILEQCKHKKQVFPIDPIGKITFSGSSNTLLRMYEKGSLHAVTGTIGSKIEQKEARLEFGIKFISIPPHNDKRRFDRPTRITQNVKEQLDALVEHIVQSRAKGQPILLVCKNDNESELLHDELAERLKTKDQLTRIHAGINYNEEAYYIKHEAGKPGQVTITTEMEGRGVDIELQDNVRNTGLKVLLTYLPYGTRNYRQLIGRSGRYGALGETQMVLNFDDLKKDFGSNEVNDTLYLNTETSISTLQILATYKKDLRRLFYRTYDNHLSHFLKRYAALSKNDKLVDSWSDFLEEYNHSKEHSLQEIEQELEEKNPTIIIINQQMDKHSVKAQNLWMKFINKLPQNQKETEEALSIPNLVKPKLLDQWFDKLKDIEKDSVTIINEVATIEVQENYDSIPGDRVQIVKNPNIIKSCHALTPNFQAWNKGLLSTDNLLSQLPVFCLFYQPKKETHPIKRKIPTSHIVFWELADKDDEEARPEF